jgi:hypothetical protein
LLFIDIYKIFAKLNFKQIIFFSMNKIITVRQTMLTPVVFGAKAVILSPVIESTSGIFPLAISPPSNSH